MTKTALITGATGQDGWYLAKLLKEKGYTVHGTTTMSKPGVGELTTSPEDPCNLHYFDLTDPNGILSLLQVVEPDEVYNLAAQSHVGLSFIQPTYTFAATGQGAVNVFEACRQYRDFTKKEIRIYQASSSEMFGNSGAFQQHESTPFDPCSPYAVAKVYAHHAAHVYRDAYGMKIWSGILFNHESIRRGAGFVTKKVCKAAAQIQVGVQDTLTLGNMDSARDWGYAGDYVEAMWLMLQSEKPDDYVVATGVTHTIYDLVDIAFGQVGLNWRNHVTTDSSMFRENDVVHLRGDASKITRELGWQPKQTFRGLIHMMVDHEINQVGKGSASACIKDK